MAKSKMIERGVGFIPDAPPIPAEDGKLTAQHVAYIFSALKSMQDAINGNLTFGNGENSTRLGNFFGQTKEVFFKNADQDYEVPHDLGRVPVGIILLNFNADGAVVRPSNAGSWTPTRLFVRCDTANTTALFGVI